MTYEEFIKSTADFNSMKMYHGVTRSAENIGFKVQNVVYRGYQASDQLQQMHDSAIQSRTKLHHEAEAAEQLQRIEDLVVKKKLERSMEEMQIEHAAKEHALKLLNLEHKENLLRQELQHKELMRQKQVSTEADLNSLKLKNEEQIKFYNELKQLGVDLTKYLCIQPVNKLIKIEGNENSSSPSLIFNVEDQNQKE